MDSIIHDPPQQIVHPLARLELAAEGLDLGEGEDEGEATGGGHASEKGRDGRDCLL